MVHSMEIKEYIKNKNEILYHQIARLVNGIIRNFCINTTGSKVNAKMVHEKEKKYNELKMSIQNVIEQKKASWEYCDWKVEFIDYTILSFNGDTLGKTFKKNGIIYRGVYASKCEYFKKLWKDGILQGLAEVGMIPQVEITDYGTKEYPIILQIESVEINNYMLWTYSMVKDACVFLGLLKEILNYNGYTLQDGHLNNVTFYCGHPLFIDIGSIIGLQHTFCNEEIVFTGCYRLMFEKLGNCMLAKNMVFDTNNNSIWIEPRYYDANMREYRYLLKLYKRFHRVRSSIKYNQLIKKVFDRYEVLPENIELLFMELPKSLEKKIGGIVEDDFIIKKLKKVVQEYEDIKTLISVGGMTVENIDKILEDISCIDFKFIDYNEKRIDDAYRYFKNIRKASFYRYNFCYGGDIDTVNFLKSDIVFNYDLVSNNSLSNKSLKHFDGIVYSMHKLTSKYALICVEELSREQMESFLYCWELFFDTLSYEKINDSIEAFLGKRKIKECNYEKL